jgi:hypothetical protein
MAKKHAKEVQLSVGLALDQVRESSNKVRHLNAELDFARRERDRFIQDALQYVPMTQMMKITGLSRDMLYRIKNRPRD